jgi:hypothetical protein
MSLNTSTSTSRAKPAHQGTSGSVLCKRNQYLRAVLVKNPAEYAMRAHQWFSLATGVEIRELQA